MRGRVYSIPFPLLGQRGEQDAATERKTFVKKLLGLILLCLLTQPMVSQQAPDAGIEGVAVRFGTGEPLSNAKLELRGGSETLSTTTETDGKFYFPNLQPGTYRILAWRDGFWPAEYGQRWVDGPGQPITLTAGQKLPDIRITMTPGGVISGRITNSLGQPLVGARVRAMKPWIQENQRVLRNVQEVVADDLGEYRLIWLLPGRYYISATMVNFPAGAQLVINPDAANTGPPDASRSASRPVTAQSMPTGIAEDEVYAPIYFPTTPDGARALAIDLPQGTEYSGVDINLTPTHTYHVRGVVSNPPPPPPQGGARGGPGVIAGIQGGLQPGGGFAAGPAVGAGQRGGPIPQVPIRLTPTTPNGSLYSTGIDPATGAFDFPKVIPGAYVSYLFIDGMTIRAPVEVGNSSVDAVYLTVTSGLTIPVHVSFDGEPPSKLPDLRSLNPTLWRNPTLMNAPAMPATRTGDSPALQNIAPGDYFVYVNPILPALNGNYPVNTPPAWMNAYVKSMRLGDVDVLNTGLRFESQPQATLEVVIGANPGRLEGRALDDRREPVPSAVVTLLAAERAIRLYRTDMYKVTSTDASGRFQVQGLPPGDYKVFAWDGVENGSWMDPELVARYENWGQTVHIEEGKSNSVDLPIINLR